MVGYFSIKDIMLFSRLCVLTELTNSGLIYNLYHKHGRKEGSFTKITQQKRNYCLFLTKSGNFRSRHWICLKLVKMRNHSFIVACIFLVDINNIDGDKAPTLLDPKPMRLIETPHLLPEKMCANQPMSSCGLASFNCHMAT